MRGSSSHPTCSLKGNLPSLSSKANKQIHKLHTYGQESY